MSIWTNSGHANSSLNPASPDSSSNTRQQAWYGSSERVTGRGAYEGATYPVMEENGPSSQLDPSAPGGNEMPLPAFGRSKPIHAENINAQLSKGFDRHAAQNVAPSRDMSSSQGEQSYRNYLLSFVVNKKDAKDRNLEDGPPYGLILRF
eukprot:TRINITY_DN31013_c0_g1_i1.p1 TRINITY_DN31013_c0_g1~~TRINITY_DN31013_c0_g1_i1.p1  ORF type:complete len:149 (+),score=21.91 TRINITY_DN31013_c0_g1_i1:68-514(+)